MKNIFIIGTNVNPASSGSFETFVDELIKGRQDKNIKYHVACKGKENGEYEYNNARCFNVTVPEIGVMQTIYYNIKALKESIKYIKENDLDDSIIFILACKTGPFIGHYKKILEDLEIPLLAKLSGHELNGDKWSNHYKKISVRLMVKYSDLLICDSKKVEEDINKYYKEYYPETTLIEHSTNSNNIVREYEDVFNLV